MKLWNERVYDQCLDILANFGKHKELQNPLCAVFSEHQNQIRNSALTTINDFVKRPSYEILLRKKCLAHTKWDSSNLQLELGIDFNHSFLLWISLGNLSKAIFFRIFIGLVVTFTSWYTADVNHFLTSLIKTLNSFFFQKPGNKMQKII